MQSIIKYLTYTFLVQAHIIRHPNKTVQSHILSKRTLNKLIRLILRYPFDTLYNAMHYRQSVYMHSGKPAPFMQSLRYRLNNDLPMKILITPSYCEKPVNCPVRFKDYCEQETCDIECKFRQYPQFANENVEYYYLTDDESIADKLIEAFHFHRKTGGRYLFVMSICRFSSDFTKLFGVFGAWIYIHAFTCTNACQNIIHYFAGDAGLNLKVTGQSIEHNRTYLNILKSISEISE